MAGLIPRKRLRIEEFRRLVSKKNWTTQDEIADALGMSQSQVSRVLDGNVRPGERFITGCVHVWGHAVVYDVLLEDDVVPADEPATTDDEAAA
jgi:transcriptional regulator with XRE-family HTH domain